MRFVFMLFAVLFNGCTAAPPGIGALRNQIRGYRFSGSVHFVISALSCQKYYDQVCQVCSVVFRNLPCSLFGCISVRDERIVVGGEPVQPSHISVDRRAVFFFVAMAGRYIPAQNAVAHGVAEFEKDEVSEDREFTLLLCFSMQPVYSCCQVPTW